MKSRAARFTVGALAFLAIGGAAAFLVYSETHLIAERRAARVFDLRARETADAIADLRLAEQAYVAAGQDVTFWVARVGGLLDSITQSCASLQASASSASARAALDEAASSVAEFAATDKRARDYIKSGQTLMAGDVIFTEGRQAAAFAARYLETARLAEHQALDAMEADRRKLQAGALAGAGGLAVLALLLLGWTGRAAVQREEASTGLGLSGAAATPAAGDLMLHGAPRRETTPTSVFSARAVSPILKSAGALCTELARVTSLEDLTGLLGRAADMLDASGVIIWLGNATGADLRPVLAHGYTDQALARMPTVARSADNAAAMAYRTGTMQIVLSRPGVRSGAIVAPLLGPEGCIGALSAEIASGGEASDAVQALATLFAAQLAAVLAAPADTEQAKAAAGS